MAIRDDFSHEPGKYRFWNSKGAFASDKIINPGSLQYVAIALDKEKPYPVYFTDTTDPDKTGENPPEGKETSGFRPASKELKADQFLVIGRPGQPVGSLRTDLTETLLETLGVGAGLDDAARKTFMADVLALVTQQQEKPYRPRIGLKLGVTKPAEPAPVEQRPAALPEAEPPAAITAPARQTSQTRRQEQAERLQDRLAMEDPPVAGTPRQGEGVLEDDSDPQPDVREGGEWANGPLLEVRYRHVNRELYDRPFSEVEQNAYRVLVEVFTKRQTYQGRHHIAQSDAERIIRIRRFKPQEPRR